MAAGPRERCSGTGTERSRASTALRSPSRIAPATSPGRDRDRARPRLRLHAHPDRGPAVAATGGVPMRARRGHRARGLGLAREAPAQRRGLADEGILDSPANRHNPDEAEEEAREEAE